MITSLYTYVLNIPLCEIFEKDIELFKKNNLTYMMSMVDLVAIDVDTLWINIGCSLEKELT